jgi:hypothetical protein
VRTYRRFQSAVPNRRGTFRGVFGLANGLARQGLLSPEDHAWWVAENQRGDELYTDPSTVDPTCYDRTADPGARAWFKAAASHLIAVAADYLNLLDRYGVPLGGTAQRIANPLRGRRACRRGAVHVPGGLAGPRAGCQGAPRAPSDTWCAARNFFPNFLLSTAGRRSNRW